MNFFDYFGAILSYIIVSIPLFSGTFDGLMAGELAAVVSKVFETYLLLSSYNGYISPTCYNVAPKSIEIWSGNSANFKATTMSCVLMLGRSSPCTNLLFLAY